MNTYLLNLAELLVYRTKGSRSPCFISPRSFSAKAILRFRLITKFTFHLLHGFHCERACMSDPSVAILSFSCFSVFMSKLVRTRMHSFLGVIRAMLTFET